MRNITSRILKLLSYFCLFLHLSMMDSLASQSDAIFEQGHASEGKGDLAKALSLYKRAANKGHVGAMNKVGMLLEKGFEGKPANPKIALEWFGAATERGDEEGMLKLK